VEDPNHKGNVAELAIATEAARLGLSVLKPLTEHERYDLVLGVAGRLLRVQCKWGTRSDDVISVRLATSRRGSSGYVRTRYSIGEIDAIGVYCEELEECFLIPIEKVAGQSSVRLRLAPAGNGQRAALHFANQYRLGAVAQLEERRHGMAEVRGSSPLSSTPMQVDLAPTTEEVGAHEFRNRFGLYMERAAGGSEFLISRHGRPYARLGPPNLNPSPSAADE
jgi:prevent-host-death family protein